MYEFVTEATLPEYESFLRRHPKGHFAQSSLWAKQKPAWLFRAVMVRDPRGKIRGSMGFLIRRVPVLGISMLYSCRGPVCDLDDFGTMAELIRGARALAKEYRGYVIKIDPDVPKENAAYREYLLQLGFRRLERGDGFGSAQPRFVFRLPVKGRTEDTLLANFSQKCRYNLRLAQRKGVEVRVCGQEMVPAFAALMEQTAVRDHFVPRQQEYFSAMLRNLGSHVRLYMAFFREEPIAGALAIAYGTKTWYLYGASANTHRNHMPNYLLQWEMIRWALENGSEIYDFRGISGNLDQTDPLYGLYQFKKGFGGEFTEFVGEMDLALRPVCCRLMDLALWLHRKRTVQKG